MGKSFNYGNEAKMFFQIASELRHATVEGATQAEIDYLVDEVDTMLKYTDSPIIRERCAKLLGQHRASLPILGS